MLRYVCLSVLLVSSCLPSARGISAQLLGDDRSTLYKLEGTVLNGQTGRPLPHALVEVYCPGRHAVLTGPDGRFGFDGCPKGTAYVAASKPGFFTPGISENRSQSKPVEVGLQRGPVELKLMPEGVIFGQVTDNQGEPLEGVSVEALMVRLTGGQRSLNLVRGNVRSDEDGNFRMGDLRPGRYYIRVKPGPVTRRIFGVQAKTPAEAYPALVYYPAAADLSAASPIDLAPGQRAQAQFSLKLGPAFKLGGVIAGLSAYKNVNPPEIVDESENQLLPINRWDNHTGAFEFSVVPAGTHKLRLGGMDEGNRYSRWTETITLDRDLTDLNLAMPRGVTVPVVVHSELRDTRGRRCSGESHDSQGKRFDWCAMSVMAILASVDMSNVQVGAQPEGQQDSPVVAFHSVMPGRYRVQVTPLVAAYIAAVRSNGADLLREDFIVPAGGSAAPIEIVLRDGGAIIKVRVQSDTPVENGRIVLVPEFAPRLSPVVLDIDPGGERLYGNLAPGDYRVLAFDSIDGIEYDNPEALEKYSSRAARVTLSAQATTPVTVDIIHTGD